MTIVGIDFKQLERCTGGYDYILVIKDHFTYYTEAFPTYNKSLKTNTKNLLLILSYILAVQKRSCLTKVKSLEERIYSTIIQMLKLLSQSCKSR